MTPTSDVQATLHVGEPLVVESPSSQGRWAVVFEDDGETGYFYALDRSQPDAPIVDALHIYNVQAVTDRALPSTVQITWSTDGQKALLMINDYPHALFDFLSKVGYTRTAFPPLGSGWKRQEWHERLLVDF